MIFFLPVLLTLFQQCIRSIFILTKVIHRIHALSFFCCMTNAKLGFYAAWCTAIAAICYTISQLLQLLKAINKPLDDILIYSTSLCIAPPFLLAILALHYTVSPDKKMWTHAALIFAVLYNAFVMLMYVVQLAAVIPYDITNPVLTVMPHSLFWTIDALGYINMGLASLFLVPVFRRYGQERFCRWFFLVHALITVVVVLVYFYPTFSVPLLLMATPWCITAPGAMICLSLFFLKTMKIKTTGY